jgi:hypothetical protein
MTTPFLESLSVWPGRAATEDALARRGFKMPRIWQQDIIDSCGVHEAENIHHYWDEIAKETVLSGWSASPRSRRFKGETNYRSTYLDELALAAVDFVRPPFTQPELIRCLYERQASNDMKVRTVIAAKIEERKQKEIARLKISAEGWTGLKRDVVPLFRQYAELKGFTHKKNRLIKECASGLIFICWVDAGGTPSCLGLPIYFSISHQDDPDSIRLADLGDVIPCFAYYSTYKSPESAVLGLHAHVEMFDVLVELFDASPRSPQK